jgi:hypothetical protein
LVVSVVLVLVMALIPSRVRCEVHKPETPLGGKANFKVDRDAAERAYAAWPGGLDGVRADARAHRAVLGRTVGRVMAPLARASYLALSHLARDVEGKDITETFSRLNAVMAESVVLRTRDEVTGLFGGLDIAVHQARAA